MAQLYFSSSTPRQRFRDVIKHVEDSSLRVCDAVSLGKYFRMCERMAVPLSSGPSGLRIRAMQKDRVYCIGVCVCAHVHREKGQWVASLWGCSLTIHPSHQSHRDSAHYISPPAQLTCHLLCPFCTHRYIIYPIFQHGYLSCATRPWR
jgi:hypothetical protein